jgi:hypothetical protein
MEMAAPGDGIHLTWQYCQSTKASHEELSVPFSALIELLAPVEGMHVLQYPPSLCGNCKSALNCYCEVDYERSMWRCPVWCAPVYTALCCVPSSSSPGFLEALSRAPCGQSLILQYDAVALCKLSQAIIEALPSSTCQQSCLLGAMLWSMSCQPRLSLLNPPSACSFWICAYQRRT